MRKASQVRRQTTALLRNSKAHCREQATDSLAEQGVGIRQGTGPVDRRGVNELAQLPRQEAGVAGDAQEPIKGVALFAVGE